MNSLQKILRLYFFKLVDASLLCYGNYVPEATKRYHLGVKYNFSQNMFLNHHLVKKFAEPKDLKLAEFHTKLAEKRRLEILERSKYGDDLIPVENCIIFDNDMPILFEDVFELDTGIQTSQDDRDSIYRTIDMIESNSSGKEDLSVKSTASARLVAEEFQSLQPSVLTTPRSRGTTNDQDLLCDTTDFYVEVMPDMEGIPRVMSTPDSFLHSAKYTQEDYLDDSDDDQVFYKPVDNIDVLLRTVPIQPQVLVRFSEFPDTNPVPEKHLVILVSGYMGSSFDMTYLKNNLMFLNGDNTIFVCSSINDGRSCEDIDKLGLELAREVNVKISMESGKIKL
jgi:Putative serine esterase (DUF676)